MTTPRTSPLDHLVFAGGALLLSALVAFAGCGGGVGVGGTGAFASGPITGFGSIIVNGIEFDDSTARVFDPEDAPTDRGALRLGMYAEVEGGPLGGTSTAPTATATTVRVASELAGPVAAVDVAAGTLSVLGQPVKVTAATVFDEALSGGLAGVADGTVVEVYGFADATGITATRIEPRRGSAPFYTVRGVVSALTANTFSIGTAGFSFSIAPAGLANGSLVRLRVETTPVAGRWVVIAVRDGGRRLPDAEQSRLRGPITTFASSGQFSVNGQAVDASAASFPDGVAGLAVGVKVRVQGTTSGGVLRASVVTIDDDGGAAGDFELKGSIDTHQPAQKTFVLKGVTVFYGGPVVFDPPGTAADLGPRVEVEVRGKLAGNGSRLQATKIDIVKKP